MSPIFRLIKMKTEEEIRLAGIQTTETGASMDDT